MINRQRQIDNRLDIYDIDVDIDIDNKVQIEDRDEQEGCNTCAI